MNNEMNDELVFVLNSTNNTMAEVYKKIYEISMERRSSFIDDRIKALMSGVDGYDSSFISIHINTIFKEYIRKELEKKSLMTSSDVSLLELLSIHDKIEEISYNPDLVSCLRDITRDSCDLFTVANMLGVDISTEILMIEDYSGYIGNLYIDNAESIYRDPLEPLEVPTVL